MHIQHSPAAGLLNNLNMKTKPPSWINKAAAGLIFAIMVLALAEAVLRAAGFSHERRLKMLYNPTVSGFIGTLQFFLPTTYMPPGYLWISQPNSPYTDRYGFRLPELDYDKPADKIRVAFLGGSTTQGGYRPYPERAIRLINAAIGTNQYEALNAACSSYSLHQSLKAYERWIRPRKPDILFVYHGWNDVVVTDDGYSDREKDPLVKMSDGPRFPLAAAMHNLRITDLAAKLYESTDRTWPRQRVSFEDFESGLNHLAEVCKDDGIRLIIMTRPMQQENLLSLDPVAPDSTAGKHALKHFETLDPSQIYAMQCERITGAQKRVAEAHPHVDVCDGQVYIAELIRKCSENTFGEKVSVFRSDDCHLYEFADEFLAQQVAVSIAPHHSAAISNHVASSDYLMEIALELHKEDAPREAAWFIREAINTTSSEIALKEMREKLQLIEQEFEFVDMFRKGRMGGEEEDYLTKIELLKDCHRLRPDDYGVIFQLYFVYFSIDHGAEFSSAVSGFKPQNKEHAASLSLMNLESHLLGERWAEARAAAAQVLAFNPNNKLALSIINQP